MYTVTCRDWHKAKTADRLTIGFIKYLEPKSTGTFVNTLRLSERFSLYFFSFK